MTCQRCGQAEAEWKVKEMLAESGQVVRWWHLCDVCLLEDFGPWIGKKIPLVDDGCVWVSKDRRQYRQVPAPSAAPPTTTPSSPPLASATTSSRPEPSDVW